MYYDIVGESRNTYKRHIFLNEMLSGQSKDYLDNIIFHESEKTLEFDPEHFYLCLTGLPKSVYFNRYGVTANDMMLLYVTLEKEIVALWHSLGGRGEVILHLYGEKQIVLVFSFDGSGSQDEKALRVAELASERLQDLYEKHFLRDDAYANVTLLSGQLRRWEEIGPTLSRMRESWKQCAFFHMEAKVWTQEQWDRPPAKPEDPVFNEALFQARQAIRAGDDEAIRQRAEALLGFIKPQNNWYLLNDAMILLKEFERECITAYALTGGDLDHVFDPHSYPNIEHLEHGITTELCGLAQQIRDKGVQYSPLVQKAMRLIQEHYASPDVSLTFIAERLNISSAYLSSIFKKETGVNLVQCIKTTRLRQARKLLKTSELRVHEIARQVGFQDKRYFCTTFKQEVGVTPHQYRSNSG